MAGTIGGSPAGNIGTHYGDTSVVTDVSDLIYQITPEDTPLFHLTEDVPASAEAPYHEWQVRELSTRQDNAQMEGFTYTFTGSLRLPTRKANILQILAEDIRISNSNQAFSHYGIPSMRADQIETRLTELKTHIEVALIRGTIASGASGVARRMQGLLQMANSNQSMFTNNSSNTLTEGRFNAFLEQGWNAGASFRDVLTGGRLKRTISNFTGGATRFIAAEAQRSINSIDMIETEFGPVNMHLCRDLPTFDSGTTFSYSLLFLDKTHIRKAWKRPVQVTGAAKIADSDDYIATAELTLEYGHPNSTGYMQRISTAV